MFCNMVDRICRMIDLSHLLKPSMIRHILLIELSGRAELRLQLYVP